MPLSKGVVLIVLPYLLRVAMGATTPFIGGASIRIEKFEQCPDKLDMPNIFSRTRATQNGLNDVSIDGSIYVRQEIVDPASSSESRRWYFGSVRFRDKLGAFQRVVNDFRGINPTELHLPVDTDWLYLKVMLYKCESKDAPSTCEYYYTYSTKEFCKFLGMDGMPWTDFWFQTTMPHSCPIPVGNYSMNGAKISMANIPDASFLHGYWKIRSTGKSGGKSWHCAIAEFSFGPVVNKRKRNKKQG